MIRDGGGQQNEVGRTSAWDNRSGARKICEPRLLTHCRKTIAVAYRLVSDFFVYWLCPSGLLLREVRPVWLLAVPRLDELPARDVVVRDDFSVDLFCPACEWPVLLVDSFMSFKELSETLVLFFRQKGIAVSVEKQSCTACHARNKRQLD